MDRRWHIDLLGGLRVTGGDGASIARFRTQKTAALLAYLAFYPARSHPRELLADLLWPDATPDAGRHSLRMALSSLRRQLEPPGVPTGAILVAYRDSVALNPAAVTTDVGHFEETLRAAARAETGPARVERLAAAAELYRGELLPGFYEEWVVPERQRLDDLFQDTLRQLVFELAQSEEFERALSYARRRVSADPLNEDARRELMRLYAAAGQPAAALKQYAELERLLRQELDDTPEAATRALLEQIRRGTRNERAEPPRATVGATEARPTGTSPGIVTLLLLDRVVRDDTGSASARASSTWPPPWLDLIARQGGTVVAAAPDALCAAFARPTEALACAGELRRSESAGTVCCRLALETGEAEGRGRSFGESLRARATRLLLAAHAGQSLASETTAALLQRAAAAESRLTDLGTYRLQEEGAPERVFQLDFTDLPPRRFPRLNAGPDYKGSLPLWFTRFFGREPELSRLAAWLHASAESRSSVRLTTLTGAGGSGKTRLACEAAARSLEMFHGAVWFVPLADVADPHQLPLVLRDALRLPATRDTAPLEQVVAMLSRQPALLIFDNCEHLLPHGAALIRTLLERLPALTVIATSRRLLELPGERQITVPPLPAPSPTDTLEHVAQSPSVQLFVDRAQAVHPDFQVTRANAAAVAALCEQLEAIPLALELAAARASVLTPAQMRDRLTDRFQLLVDRRSTSRSRHQSLWVTMDWSYQLLLPDLQRCFARLSVFRGGWSLDAASAIAAGSVGGPGTPDALDQLEQLRADSLIQQQESGDEMRFRMLETLREFAAEQLPPDERESLARRHARYYLQLAETEEADIAWLARMEREHDNLRAALAWALRAGELEIVYRLGGVLHVFWGIRGYAAEGRQWMKHALEADEHGAVVTDPRVKARALHAAGELAWTDADPRAARMFLEQALDQFRAGPDPAREAEALNLLGTIARAEGRLNAATAHYEESLARSQATGDPARAARSLWGIGSLARDRGDLPRAQQLYEESLALCRALDSPTGIAYSLSLLAMLLARQGYGDTAQTFLEEGLSLARQVEDRTLIGSMLEGMAWVARCRGAGDEAVALYAESLAVRRKHGDQRGVALILNCLGELAWLRGDARRAGALCREALELDRRFGDCAGIARSLRGLGCVALVEHELQQARARLGESLAVEQELNHQHGIVRTLYALAWLAAGEGRPEHALRVAGAAAALEATLGASVYAPDERARLDAALRPARDTLGEAAAAQALAGGRRMAVEEACSCALQPQEAA